MKDQIIKELSALIDMYLARADEALVNKEFKSCDEYSDKANGLMEAREIVQRIKE